MSDDNRMQHNTETYAANTGAITGAAAGMILAMNSVGDVCGTDVMTGIMCRPI